MPNENNHPKPKTHEQPSDEGLSSSALFACPFCDSPAEMDYSEMERRAGIAAAVKCTSESCRTFGPDGRNAEEAARKWNKRNSPFCNACKEPDCKVSGDGTCAMIRKYLANATAQIPPRSGSNSKQDASGG